MNTPVSRVYVVTHANTNGGPDPELNARGKAIIRYLKAFLPENISLVISGFGRRHRGIATELGLAIDSYHLIAGTAVKLKEADEEMVILSDGTEIPRKKLNRFGLSDLAKAFVRSLPDHSLICAGRPLIRYLTDGEAFSSSLYCLEIREEKIEIQRLHSWGNEGAEEKEV